MSERTASSSVVFSAMLVVAVVAGAFVLAVWSHLSRDATSRPQDVLVRAVEQLESTSRFTVTTEHSPDGTGEASSVTIHDFDGGRVARLRTFSGGELESDQCWIEAFTHHWLHGFGTASEAYHQLDLSPEGFRWGWPGSPANGRVASVEFSYYQFSIDSIVPVEATAWIDLKTNELIRIERDIFDPIGFQGRAVTTVAYGEATSCI